MPEFQPVLLARVGKPDSPSLATYQADGGYEALKKALGMPPDDVQVLYDFAVHGNGPIATGRAVVVLDAGARAGPTS